MTYYDFLLNKLVSESKGKLNHEQVDKEITQLAAVANKSKLDMLIAYRQVLLAYGIIEEAS